MILYVNSCIRKESRTNKLAHALLSKLNQPYEEIVLINENLKPLDEKGLKKRQELIKSGNFTDSSFRYAHQFINADTIVISAPLWDASFPSSLKLYIENICISGLTFQYTEEGNIKGFCKAQKLYYVSTSGGLFIEDFGYKQIETLAHTCFGIPKTELIKAEFLDIAGNNPEEIINKAIKEIK